MHPSQGLNVPRRYIFHLFGQRPEDVEEVPSEDEAIAGAAALEADGDGLLKRLKKEN